MRKSVHSARTVGFLTCRSQGGWASMLLRWVTALPRHNGTRSHGTTSPGVPSQAAWLEEHFPTFLRLWITEHKSPHLLRLMWPWNETGEGRRLAGRAPSWPLCEPVLGSESPLALAAASRFSSVLADHSAIIDSRPSCPMACDFSPSIS